MKEKIGISNVAAFFIRDESGKITSAGTIEYKKVISHGGPAIETTVKALRENDVDRMINTMPPGGISVVDKMTGGRIELVTANMEDNIPFSAIVESVDRLRDHYNIPLSAECAGYADSQRKAAREILVKPNPTKS